MLFTTLHQGAVIPVGLLTGMVCALLTWGLEVLGRKGRVLSVLCDILTGACCAAALGLTVWRVNEGVPRLLMLLWVPVGWWVFHRGIKKAAELLLSRRKGQNSTVKPS